MTVESPLYQALRRIREAQIPAADREILRPALAAPGQQCAIAIGQTVIAREHE